jgi:FAD/FMN-containing dehydrogenase
MPWMETTRRRFIARSAAGAALLALGEVSRVGAAQTRLPAAWLNELKSAVRGPVLAPGAAGYDAARFVFNERFDAIKPPAVVQARDATDVIAAVRWAARHDVPLVSRSGGHGYTGNSTSSTAVVVDVGALDHISLNGSIATVGPGARILDTYAALAAHGLTVPAGSCPSVAVGGLVLGGGMGLAGRALGLTIDRVASFDVVTADGRRRRVDAHHDPDLFWALRGGGGSFAIVTAVRLRTHKVSSGAWFRVTYPAASRDEALAAWDALAPSAPPELTAILTISSTNAAAFGQYLGSEQALRRLVAPLARVPGATLSAGTDNYLGLQRRWAGCTSGPVSACKRIPRDTFDAASVYVTKRLTAAGRHAFVAAADTGATLICDAYGGAINQVHAGSTAFVHRNARFSVQIVSYAPIATSRARVRTARALIAPHGDGHAYQNYPDLDQPGPLRAYYGGNLHRLKTVKAAIDPDNRFRVVQGISA